MAEPSLGTEHLLPYERGGDSPASAEQGLADLLASNPELGGEAPTESDEAPPEEQEAEGESELEEETSDDGESDDTELESDEQDEEPVADVFSIDGETVTLQELKDGRLRQADYTRKTQALADDRKTFESERQQTRDQYGQRLAMLEQALVESQPAEPDWDKLRRENPAEYAALKAEAQERKDKLAAVRAEQDAVRAEQEREFHAKRQEHLRTEGRLLIDAIPEWKDEAKATEEVGKLVSYLNTTYGWTPEDLGDVGDHKIVVALRKAMLYDELKAKGEAVRERAKSAPVLKPGAPKKPMAGPKSDQRRAINRLRQTKHPEDAAAAIRQFLGD